MNLMIFEVFDSDGMGMLRCKDIMSIPDKQTLKSMSNAGFKFKLNGKSVGIRKLNEIIESYKEDENGIV